MTWGTFVMFVLFIAMVEISMNFHITQGKLRKHDVELPFQLNSVVEFRKRTRKMLDSSVSIVTHVSVDKLYRLVDIVERWKGPISCAVYSTRRNPNEVEKLFLENPQLEETLTIHLVLASNTSLPYPINVMRNVALKYSDTPYVFAIDVDFIPSATALDEINRHVNRNDDRKKVWIVPAFERHVRDGQHISARSLPETKPQLMREIAKRTIEPFHVSYFAPGHGPTQFPRWYQAEKEYLITWEPRFEPYIVAFKEGLPEYWNGFTGYGYNKLSWIMELNLAGYSFHVLPSCFLIHINHPGRQGRWPKSAMQSEYFDRFVPYLKEKYEHVVDVDWV